ncbi:hypothetical protein PZA11_007042 [Diplocarpon coronariae]
MVSELVGNPPEYLHRNWLVELKEFTPSASHHGSGLGGGGLGGPAERHPRF